MKSDFTAWIPTLAEATVQASSEILRLYHSKVDIFDKPDATQVTTADLAAHDCIQQHLNTTPFPVCSEEGLRQLVGTSPETFWLVDPIDGTTEFIEKTGEFTVNIALIHHGKPVLGAMSAPAAPPNDQGVWLGVVGEGLFRKENQDWVRHQPTPHKEDSWILLGSRRDMRQGAGGFTEKMRQRGLSWREARVGSSLKLLRIARGLADAYPRSSHLHHWDIAAGHALVLAAGGQMMGLTDGSPLNYQWEQEEMPEFLALAPGRIWDWD
jgi:3'(2'), 5'-bisphosphate nucleotidase